MIRGIPHHALKRVHHAVVGRLTQGHKQSLGFVHAAMLHERRQSGNPPSHGGRSLRRALAVTLAPIPTGLTAYALGHAARHEAADIQTQGSARTRDNRSATPSSGNSVRFLDHGLVRNVPPLAFDADAIVTVFGFPIDVRQRGPVSVGAARPLLECRFSNQPLRESWHSGHRDRRAAALCVCSCPVIACRVLAPYKAAARDLDGRYANLSPQRLVREPAFEQGPCCSRADGTALSDVDLGIQRRSLSRPHRRPVVGRSGRGRDQGTEPNCPDDGGPIYYRGFGAPCVWISAASCRQHDLARRRLDRSGLGPR